MKSETKSPNRKVRKSRHELPKTILCVSTYDGARGPMMKAILANCLQEAGILAQVESAGIHADIGLRAELEAIEVLKAIGLDISNHRSRPISAINSLDRFDLIIADEETANHLRRLGPVPDICIPDATSNDMVTPRKGNRESFDRCLRGLLRAAVDVENIYFS